jgi:hypothetical protein
MPQFGQEQLSWLVTHNMVEFTDSKSAMLGGKNDWSQPLGCTAGCEFIFYDSGNVCERESSEQKNRTIHFFVIELAYSGIRRGQRTNAMPQHG